jgi:hypothetical protein
MTTYDNWLGVSVYTLEKENIMRGIIYNLLGIWTTLNISDCELMNYYQRLW